MPGCAPRDKSAGPGLSFKNFESGAFFCYLGYALLCLFLRRRLILVRRFDGAMLHVLQQRAKVFFALWSRYSNPYEED